MKAAAVIVTYNRIELLKSLITALRNQTHLPDALIVVNNSSTDGTAEWLRLQGDITTINQANMGGAGGFYSGMKAAYELDYEWIWCMDDDCSPDNNALKHLFESQPLVPSVINSLVLDIKDKKTFPFKVPGYKNIDDVKVDFIGHTLIPFNGTLFHRDVFTKVGFPDHRMVIWGDETEFFYRVKNKGKFPVGVVTRSVLYHPLNNGRFYLSEWDVVKEWRAYFFVRNKLFVYRSKYQYRLFAYIHYICFAALFLLLIPLFNRRDILKKLHVFNTAFRHALSGNLTWSIHDVKDFLNTLKPAANTRISG